MTSHLTPEQLIGERIGGRFVIERAIGYGPLSSSFRARDERLHRRVTVKLFHPQHEDDVAVVDSQLGLATAVARLSHENIATVIDRGEHQGMPFVVLEYVRGENLDERIDRYAPLRVGEVVAYGTSIARALAYAHAQNVVHGNLRPGNVLISEEREVKIVDFGGGSWVAALTGNGVEYVPPEHRGLDDLSVVGQADDVYALGVLLFVALTEQHPEPGIDASRVQLLRPDVSPRLAGIVARALSADPDARYGSMREIAAELSSVRVAGFAEGAARRPDPISQETGLMQPATPLRPEARRAVATDRRATAEPARHRTRRNRSAGESRARAIVWAMVLVPVAAVMLVGLMIAGEQGSDGRSGEAPRVVNEELQPIDVIDAGTFDPGGTGVPGENDALVGGVHDGDVGTSWQTEGYDGADLTKGGVGFWVRLAAPADIRSIEFTAPLQGWTAQVFGADVPAKTLEGWKPVSDTFVVSDGDRYDVDVEEHPYTTYLVWITHLAVDTEDAEKFRAAVAEVELLARASE